MKAYDIIYSVFLLLMRTSDVTSLAAAIDPEYCEFHTPTTLHELCCDINDDNSEFVNCQIGWNGKMDVTTDEQEKHQNFCVSECVYNKTEYLGKDQKSLRMNIIKYRLNEFLGDEVAEQQLYDTYEKCAIHARDMLEYDAVKKLETKLSTYNCHPYSGLVLECVMNQMILNCPPTKFHKTAQCEEAREYLKACLKK